MANWPRASYPYPQTAEQCLVTAYHQTGTQPEVLNIYSLHMFLCAVFTFFWHIMSIIIMHIPTNVQTLSHLILKHYAHRPDVSAELTLCISIIYTHTGLCSMHMGPSWSQTRFTPRANYEISLEYMFFNETSSTAPIFARRVYLSEIFAASNTFII